MKDLVTIVTKSFIPSCLTTSPVLASLPFLWSPSPFCSSLKVELGTRGVLCHGYLTLFNLIRIRVVYR